MNKNSLQKLINLAILALAIINNIEKRTHV